MQETKRGLIRNVRISGGIIQLIVEDPVGNKQVLTGDNGPTVRALMSIFGTDIIRGHSIVVERVVGQEIGYDVDDLGVLVTIES